MEEKFDFIEEVYKQNVCIETLRLMEAWMVLNDFRNGDDDWNIEAIMGNYFDYIALKDDLFLFKLTQFHSEQELKEMIKDALDFDLNEEPDKKKIILVGDQKFKTKG